MTIKTRKKKVIFNKFDADIQFLNPNRPLPRYILSYDDKQLLKDSLYLFYKAFSSKTEKCFVKQEDRTYRFHDDEFFRLCGEEYYNNVGISPKHRKFIR